MKEVFVAAIPLASVIISGVIAFLTAKFTAKQEIKKQLLKYEHEDKEAMYNAYVYLQDKVRMFCNCSRNGVYLREADASIGTFLPYATEDMLPICNSLSNAIKNNQPSVAFEFLELLNIEWQNHKNSTHIDISAKPQKSRKTHRK